YADIDDDGDLLLDINDIESKIALLTFDRESATSPKILNVQLNINGSYAINKISAFNPVVINGENLNLSSEAFVVLSKDDANGKMSNIK
ncbi:hypothetical protein, partial [Psychrobacter sp. W2-37-MNA-CIBAN-0211]